MEVPDLFAESARYIEFVVETVTISNIKTNISGDGISRDLAGYFFIGLTLSFIITRGYERLHRVASEEFIQNKERYFTKVTVGVVAISPIVYIMTMLVAPTELQSSITIINTVNAYLAISAVFLPLEYTSIWLLERTMNNLKLCQRLCRLSNSGTTRLQSCTLSRATRSLFVFSRASYYLTIIICFSVLTLVVQIRFLSLAYKVSAVYVILSYIAAAAMYSLVLVSRSVIRKM